MSVHDQAAAAVLSQVALAADGVLLGLALAYVATRSIIRYTATSSALRKIQDAPSLNVSDLRSVLEGSDSSNDLDGGKLVIVRGIVDSKSAVDGNWTSLIPNVLISHESGERCVVLQRTQTCIYNEWRGLFGWTSDLLSLFARSWHKQESTSFRTVPFILVEGGKRPYTDYLIVNMDGSNHSLPLVTVYHQLQPISASPYTFLQALFGHEYPVGLLAEEKILPLGKDITAVGICTLKDGIAGIKPCKDLPYFLSDMTKDRMVIGLAFRSKVLLWSGIVLGALSIGILGYADVRNWNKWKEWRQQQRTQRQNLAGTDVDPQSPEDDEAGDIPDGELCVVCLMRRRRSAFIPCGHLVCCQRCALSVERDLAPKCPVCRQEIRSCVRIYDS
ncbi:E3 ubiquitin-protein like [Actinidia chinensis var. chinensis]|uniref:RING-type E3 ubiquitin transferase n=1 Tax=Actinidia chinensis var. chinensis TaxID=1590841 RepID=A0A2R6QFA7_ACTCC|nr:E3 ubiquitin-protein like [Actinidia chinensis var. chinensis]